MITYHQLLPFKAGISNSGGVHTNLINDDNIEGSEFFGKIAASSLNTGDADDVSIVQVNSPQLVVVLSEGLRSLEIQSETRC